MNASEYIWYLKFKIKGLERTVDSYRSGRKYVSLREEYESVIRKKNAEIERLKKELGEARAETVTVRNIWNDIVDDTIAEKKRAVLKAENEKSKLKKRILIVGRQRDDALNERTEWRRKYYELSERIEELEGENKKLTAQVNKDFRNSSTPSSQQGPARKKIPNSRPGTEKKRGGQPGHEGHRLTRKTPTETHSIPDPDIYRHDPDYRATDGFVKRQKIALSVSVKVTEYYARVFRNVNTGSRVHADFPEGYDTDVSYDSSVKAFVFLLANDGNMSAGKIRKVLREATDGRLDISEATINGLCREFSEKSEIERNDILKAIMTSPVVNTDFTNANVNGEPKQVLIIASPSANASLFIARDKKGHKGIAGTPVENYVGTLVHDHDTTFYSYGAGHQECMQHNIRYLIGSEENEPEREWNRQMHELVKEMLHYKNGLGGRESDPHKVAGFEKRYDDILSGARDEYENVPPSEYYREGYNLYLRLVKYKDNELLFLHDSRVPANNSLAERLARIYKRKQKQAIVLRSDDNFRYLCDSLSVINTLRQDGDISLYRKISEIFSRRRQKA